MTHQQESAQQKADMMRAYFQSAELPHGQFELKKGTTITDAAKYVNRALGTMNTYPVLSRFWLVAYYRLYQLKQYISKQKSNDKKENNSGNG